LKETGNYYRLEVHDLIEKHTVPEYMEKVIQKLHEEDMRARRYLHPRYIDIEINICMANFDFVFLSL